MEQFLRFLNKWIQVFKLRERLYILFPLSLENENLAITRPCITSTSISGSPAKSTESIWYPYDLYQKLENTYKGNFQVKNWILTFSGQEDSAGKYIPLSCDSSIDYITHPLYHSSTCGNLNFILDFIFPC